MPLYTEAIILRTYKLGEADRIVVFLTRGPRQAGAGGQGRGGCGRASAAPSSRSRESQ